MQAKVLRTDHRKAEERYRQYRQLVYEATMEQFPGVVAREVTLLDCLTADGWKKLNLPDGRRSRAAWDWTKELPFYRNKPNRFEISLCSGSTLCALCYGQTSRHGTRVRMNLIEAIPVRPNPLGYRALTVLSFAAAAFADVVGATEVWVLDPYPQLERLYGSEGFGPREIYHGKRVGQRRIL